MALVVEVHAARRQEGRMSVECGGDERADGLTELPLDRICLMVEISLGFLRWKNMASLVEV